MSVEFEVSDVIPAPPAQVYAAWLDSEAHSAMTGSMARVSSTIDDDFEAWDGYIEGKNVELEPEKRILQRWRTIEFEEADADSTLEILFEPADGGTLVTIRHSNLPTHGHQYKQGWRDSYFTPMKRHFGSGTEADGG